MSLGLTLKAASKPRNLTALVGSRWKSRGQIDLTFYVVNRESDNIQSIGSGSVTTKIECLSGTIEGIDMSSSLSIDDVVTVTVNVSPAGAQARTFSNMLILGSSTVLPLYSRTQTFGGGGTAALASMVAAGFSISSAEYLAAQVPFQQKPQLPQVKVGRRFLAAQPGALLGAAVSAATITALQAITTGGFDIAINGANQQLSALNFSADTTLAQVAATLQTALNAAVAGTTCVADGSQLVITSPTTGTSSTIGYALPPTHSGSPVDVSTLLGLAAGTGAFGYPGIAIENMTQSWTASAVFDPNFYGIVVAGGSTQDIKDTMAFADTGVYLHAYTTNDPNALLSSDTTDLFSYAQAQEYQNSFGQWSNTAYAAVSALARILIVDLTQPNSAITLKFKQEPGVAPDAINETQRLVLENKNANYYTNLAAPRAATAASRCSRRGRSRTARSSTRCSIWRGRRPTRTAYFNVRWRRALTKIDLDDSGMQIIVQALDKVMDQLVAAKVLSAGKLERNRRRRGEHRRPLAERLLSHRVARWRR